METGNLEIAPTPAFSNAGKEYSEPFFPVAEVKSL